MQMKQMSEASVYVLLAWEGEKKDKEQYVYVDCWIVQYFPLLMIS